MSRSILAGSTRATLPGAHAVGKADAAERMEVTLVLRRRDAAGFSARVGDLVHGSGDVPHLRREDFAAAHGASEADFATIRAFAQGYGLAVTQQDSARRTVVLAGTVAQFNDAFEVDLQRFEHDGGAYRGRVGDIHLPQSLVGVVEAVLGLDNRPAARAHFRKPRGAQLATDTAFTPVQLAQLYNFPPGDGTGETIAIIELGGGYHLSDLKAYFHDLGITPPAISAISVDHARNRPAGGANGPDGEVMLDIEVAGAVAPGAHYAVYFAPNTDAGFLDAITTAIHDQVRRPSIISISWGGPESSWTQQSLNAFDQAFQDAAALGITVLVAAGDDGATDNVADGQNHVDFPASSPHVTACGGTHIQVNGNTIASETVWNALAAGGGATGGGVSAILPVPAYQANVKATLKGGNAAVLARRGVPDIAGDADPASGYRVRVDGTNTVIGGTSAVAPLWAGLIALINAKRGPRGFINPKLYANPGALNDILAGDNGGYQATQGWDACTGLGTPNGTALAAVL